jgi:dienelactone hydrolase
MIRIAALIAAWLAALCASAPAAAQERPEGDWTGTMGPAQLHLVVHLLRTGTGLGGTLDSPDQGVAGLPIAAVTADRESLAFDVPSVRGHYAGRWDSAAKGYAGEWSQGAIRQPLVLIRGNVAPRAVVSGLDGDWDGTLDMAAMGRLRLVFHVRTTAAGTVAGLESPDQGTGEMPFSSLSREGEAVTLEAKAIGGLFRGRASADGATLTGTWRQLGQETPLTMKRRPAGAAGPAALRRPQTPQRPFPYREVDVSVDNPAGHVRLGGTLTLPQGPGPFPAAILITGSGPQDRDETLLGHKPFLVLSDYLTRRGIAVLRLDDRSVGASTGGTDGTTLDFATDIEAALRFLAARSDIDRRRIGLIGHSEGGVIAPMVAARSRDVAWIVLMAGPGVTGERIILAQQRLLLAASGVPKEVVEQRAAIQQRLLTAVESAPDRATALRGATAVLVGAGMKEGDAEAAAAAVASDWYRGFLRIDPAPALRSVRVPVLALIGSLDLQVPAAENIPALRAALAGNRDATVTELPGLNHLFQTAKTGAVSEYAQIEETISPAALKTIGDWIVAHTK